MQANGFVCPRDHPRVGGEKLDGAVIRQFRLGITPAWAGKRVIAENREKPNGDHPRVGGEKQKERMVG